MASHSKPNVDISISESPERAFATRPLPPLKVGRLSHRLCITGLVKTAICSLVAIGFSARSFVRWKSFTNDEEPLFHSNVTKEITSLIFNICVALSMETVGFIHATSLRWALYHEVGLEFHSNLPLFTNAE